MKLLLRLGPSIALSFFLPALACCSHSAHTAADTSDDFDLSTLSWLVGTWARATDDSLSEEHWQPPRDGVMQGISMEAVQGRMVFFEYLRIEAQPDGVYYLASPRGRKPPTAFRMIESGRHRVVFENPTHDFPQRIEYWLADDEVLHARIEGKQDGRTRSSEWTRQRPPSPHDDG